MQIIIDQSFSSDFSKHAAVPEAAVKTCIRLTDVAYTHHGSEDPCNFRFLYPKPLVSSFYQVLIINNESAMESLGELSKPPRIAAPTAHLSRIFVCVSRFGHKSCIYCIPPQSMGGCRLWTVSTLIVHTDLRTAFNCQ